MKEKNDHRFDSILLYLLDKKDHTYAHLTTSRTLPTWPQLFKRWITVSTRQISIQWIAQLVTLYVSTEKRFIGWIALSSVCATGACTLFLFIA